MQIIFKKKNNQFLPPFQNNFIRTQGITDVFVESLNQKSREEEVSDLKQQNKA